MAACGYRVAYARALATLEELRSLPVPLVLGANTGPLLPRIRHVLGLAPNTTPAHWRRSVGGAVLGLIAMALGFSLFAVSARQHEAVIRIAFEGGGTTPLGTEDSLSSTKGRDPYYIQTEVEKMKSDLVAGDVVDRLNLGNKWGQRRNRRGPLGAEEVVRLLKQRIDIRQVRGTSLIEVRVLSEDRTEAKDIADALVAAYRDKRWSRRTENARRGIAKLKEQWKAQDKTVTDAQAKLDQLREEYKVPDLVSEGPGAWTIDSEIIRQKESRRNAALEEYVSLNEAMIGLKGLSREALRNALPVQFSDSQLLDLMQRKAAAEQELAVAVKEKSDGHPDVQRLKTLLWHITEQIEGRLDGILVGLEGKVASAKTKYDTLDKELKAEQDSEIQKFRRYRPYFQAKLDLETQRKLREVLSLKIAQEEIDAEVDRTPVEIVDRSLRVVYPGREFALGLIAFGVLSSLSALVLSVTSRSRHLATTAA